MCTKDIVFTLFQRYKIASDFDQKDKTHAKVQYEENTTLQS